MQNGELPAQDKEQTEYQLLKESGGKLHEPTCMVQLSKINDQAAKTANSNLSLQLPSLIKPFSGKENLFLIYLFISH